jgi:putative phage-type endonuclease
MTLSPLRTGRITGSRVAAIIGQSPYATSTDVMREMVREHHGDDREFAGNVATQWGQDHEHLAVAMYETECGVLVHGEQGFITHPDHPYLGVTPDGLVGDDGMIEVKCPWRGKYRHISESPAHEAQIRLQLAVTGRRWCDYVVWADDRISISRVYHDPGWLDMHLPRLADFVSEYEVIVADETLSAPFRAPADRRDEDWADAADTYQRLLDERDVVDAELKEAKGVLLELAGGQPAKGRGIQVSLTKRKPRFDVDALAAYSHGLDLNMFYGEPSESWTVRRWAG